MREVNRSAIQIRDSHYGAADRIKVTRFKRESTLHSDKFRKVPRGSRRLREEQFPKHIMKDRVPEGVQAVEGAAAEAAQRVRLIQYRRNPLLLLQRRERDCQLSDLPKTKIRNRSGDFAFSHLR